MQVSDHEQLWTAVAQLLRAQVSEAVWFSTFQDVIALDSDTSMVRVSAPNAHARDRILSRYLPLVRDALEEIGAASLNFVVEVQVADNEPSAEWSPDSTSHSGQTHGPADGAGATMSEGRSSSSGSSDPSGMNPRYTFETFVKGASNQFALAAALRVAETPGRSYNPLFIYGSAGLGKTHLLHAIGHYVHHHYQHDVVRYVSTETFLNEYVDAIRTNTTANFKRRYRDIDVLLIDDIQFMEGKEGLQEEFFHTFNSLHGANKQIIISSDRMPDAIPTLEERLRGRFKWGLITDIQPPDLETRLAILRNKAERDHSPVPADTLELIASRITTNIRALEGALIRVTAYASLNQVPISTHLAEQLLGDLLSDTYVKPRTDDELLNEIAVILGYSVDSLRGKSRQRPLVTARQVAMYVFRELTDLSYPAIARVFGGRDHTTVIHAVDKIQRLMKERKDVYDQVTDLTQRLKKA
ncbi:MAG: chromosomal replication initiator protein DnaA [Actinobacteria bacterium]|nr:chromosomal replication initiator protein DnaA [Actinomycetota bacterium]MSW76603.1 chromosomal replication initiator protein DnaA [Actinomycetota bacterium]MSX54488.1 chromosomal replication initiator protein DnaA [Actinomycetota bacterium]MSX91849.1 chromosomal replication initiator protein DnaA [Actinomycetota bacterium]MSZ82050.1 chromosomal replication initiator protein DnaA [Actinomycetota bacterium]